jgi:hypothetical protein
MIAIDYIDKSTTDGLAAIYDRVRNPNAMLKVVGRRGANELKFHFLQRDRTGKQFPGRRSHFWRQIANSVNSPIVEGNTAVRISIGDPRFVQKVFGGRITPKRAKALTIPQDPKVDPQAASMARERTVAVFQQTTGIQLFLLKKKGGGISNLLAGFVSAKKLRVFYILVPYVDQEADPEALPPRAKFNAAILDEGVQFLNRQIATSERKLSS